MEESEGRATFSGKVFGIGMPRTGTTSLAAALQALGYRASHNPQEYSVLKDHDAASDSLIAVGFKALDIMYPDSRFILTVRNTDVWLDSIDFLFSWLRDRDPRPQPIVGGGPKAHMGLYGTWATFKREDLRVAYERHVADVYRFFRGRESILLTLDICAGEGWEKLCPFLGKDVPPEPFPNVNTVKDPADP